MAIAGYDDEAAQMRKRGVGTVVNLYDGVGSALAEAAEHRWPTADRSSQPAPSS